MSNTVSKCCPLSFIFNLGNKSKSQEDNWRVGRMGNNNHVFHSHKLCGFQGCVGGCVVMMKELVVFVPKFRSFSSHVFSEVSQNVTVRIGVDCSVRRNKFMVNSPLHVEKTMNMLFVELRTCCTFFALGDCGFFHCNDCCFVFAS
jgi:hypothetical protein